MTFRVAFQRDAESDFGKIASWYESQRTGLGAEFAGELDRLLVRIAERPATYPVVFREVRKAGMRRFPFLVLFRIRTQSIVVLAIVHARRSPRVWRRRV